MKTIRLQIDRAAKVDELMRAVDAAFEDGAGVVELVELADGEEVRCWLTRPPKPAEPKFVTTWKW